MIIFKQLLWVVLLLVSSPIYAIVVTMNPPLTSPECEVSVTGQVIFTRKIPATAVTLEYIAPDGALTRIGTFGFTDAAGHYKWKGKIPGVSPIPNGGSIKVTTNRQKFATRPLDSCPLRATLQPTGTCHTQTWSSSSQEELSLQATSCSISDQQAYNATKNYCSGQGYSWFNFVTSGTDYLNSSLSVSCYNPPSDGSSINPDVYNLANAMSSNYSLWQQITSATTETGVVSAAEGAGYTINTADLGGNKNRSFHPQSGCGGAGQPQCADVDCRTWATYLVGGCWVNGAPRCQTWGHHCNAGYYLDMSTNTCEPKTQISVTPLPSDLTIDGNDFSGIVGYKAVIESAEWASFYVPDAANTPVSCNRLNNYVNTYACKDASSDECLRLRPLANSCTTAPPTCSTLGITDNQGNALNTPLFTVEEWFTKSPGGLMVNANWFDISGEEGAYFPHEYPCTKIYGYSASNGNEVSSASIGDPTPSGTNLLDALVISGKPWARSIRIVPNDQIDSISNVQQAVGGFIILEDGVVKRKSQIPKSDKPSGTGSRTGVGIKRAPDGTVTMYVVVIQGGSPTYDEGLSAVALARYLKQLGATSAINLDNSGSSQLVFGASDGTIMDKSLPGDRFKGNAVFRPVPNYLQINRPN